MDLDVLKFNLYPTYLGVKPDRSLTYKTHLTKLKCKVSAGVVLARRLASTNWGASFCTLKTSVMALAFSVAEYCAPVWTRNDHICCLDVPLHDDIRLVPGPIWHVWCTPLSCSGSNHSRSVGITSADGYAEKLLNQTTSCTMSSLRKKPHAGWVQGNQCAHTWRTWKQLVLQNQRYLRGSYQYTTSGTWEPGPHSTLRLQSSQKALQPWVQLNRLRKGAGRFAANLKQWGITDSDLCPCGQTQIHKHVITYCNVICPPCPLT